MKLYDRHDFALLVAQMRELGVRSLRTADFAIELDSKPSANAAHADDDSSVDVEDEQDLLLGTRSKWQKHAPGTAKPATPTENPDE